MAFKEKQNITGSVNQKIGEVVSIDGKYIASSGVNNDEVNIYERDSLGEWSFLSTKSVIDLAPSLDINKGNIFMPVSVFPLVHFYSESDNFTTQRFIYDSSFPLIAGFGSSVSADGNYVVVGCSEFDTNKGKVYIFYKGEDENWDDDTIWTDFVTIQPNDSVTNQFFGTSVSIDGDIISVGAKGDNGSRGAVYIFERNEDTEVWEQTQKLIASDGQSGDEFGGQVSLSDSYLAIGAENIDLSDTEINVGAVYMFVYSSVWNELRKITSVNESGLIANNFGHSVDLNGDYLIVGSPNARNSGVADIFYKKRNWGHLKKIIGSGVVEGGGTSFGESVAISYPSSVVGEFGYTTGSDEGRIYIFEDPEVRLRLAQEFDADFQPSKASVYLKRSGDNSSSSWLLIDSTPSVIDSTNFSTIMGNSIFNDEVAGFTGNGYMVDTGTINYPIRNSVPNNYSIWIRCRTGSEDMSGSSDFAIDILLDGIVIKEIDETIADGGWSWVNTVLVLPDTQEHILGIRIKENQSKIDKIILSTDEDFIPEGNGPPHATSPYVTIHMKVYDTDGFSPTDPLEVYTYKTTLDEVIQDDWYNFDISLTDKIISEYGESLFLVMSSSGANADNFVTWEILDSDEYLSGNAGLRITEVGANSNYVDASLTKRFYYNAKSGEADIDTDTWYLDNTKTHVFKIFSDFDPIEDV